MRAPSLSRVDDATTAPSPTIEVHMPRLRLRRECSWLKCASSWPSTIAISSSVISSRMPV
jgi:hypothetical protein